MPYRILQYIQNSPPNTQELRSRTGTTNPSPIPRQRSEILQQNKRTAKDQQEEG